MHSKKKYPMLALLFGAAFLANAMFSIPASGDVYGPNEQIWRTVKEGNPPVWYAIDTNNVRYPADTVSLHYDEKTYVLAVPHERYTDPEMREMFVNDWVIDANNRDIDGLEVIHEGKPRVMEAKLGWFWARKDAEISQKGSISAKEEAFLKKVDGIKAEKMRKYIKRFYKTALAEYAISGQRPSQKLAQALIESGSGTSTLATKVNAHFGIKGGWTKSPLAKGGMRRTDDHPNEKFHGYESAWFSWRDHSYFLTTNARYKKTLTAKTLEQSCYFLGTSGYATCKYRAVYKSKKGGVRKGPPGSQLLNVIKSNHLEMLDRMVGISQ